MSKKRDRVSTQGGQGLSLNPFAALGEAGLPSAAPATEAAQPARSAPATPARRSRGRLDVRREKSGRGGKTVTVIFGFKGISAEEKAQLAHAIQKRCGVGGAVKDGAIEIQGDKRAEARAILEEAGFQVVLAGG